ncbi:hypothetical protein [Roseovarius sp. D0-M9]|uniref:hypothetical protein n=1 Tax=Roseovarius sp. D0-M9 TaxID=3127117 RepID=UPI00300F92C2
MPQTGNETSTPKHSNNGPEIAPHGREQMMESHKDRRRGEPAAASLETDAESGGASAVAGLPEDEAPRDPAKPYLDGGATTYENADGSGGGAWIKWAIAALLALALFYAALTI